VDGPNTEIMLQRKGRFAPQVALKIGLDMSGAFEAAEAAGIVHRDIKPANILVNSQGVAKLTDLGLASASHGDRRVTMAGFCVGTPYYIAPEQARGEANVDGRADIYSLGATLYHLVTGTLPFPGANPVVIMTKHLQEMPPPPHVREPSVPAPVSALIMKMMAKDPAQRPQNAAQLRGDLERALRGEMPLPANGAALPSDAAGSSSIAARDAVPLLDRLFTLADKLLPFVPAVIRLPVAAVVITVVVIAILWAAVVLSRS
jgi:serine/threonine-protein kinase